MHVGQSFKVETPCGAKLGYCERVVPSCGGIIRIDGHGSFFAQTRVIPRGACYNSGLTVHWPTNDERGI
jgi:hypothetical protein